MRKHRLEDRLFALAEARLVLATVDADEVDEVAATNHDAGHAAKQSVRLEQIPIEIGLDQILVAQQLVAGHDPADCIFFAREEPRVARGVLRVRRTKTRIFGIFAEDLPLPGGEMVPRKSHQTTFKLPSQQRQSIAPAIDRIGGSVYSVEERFEINSHRRYRCVFAMIARAFGGNEPASGQTQAMPGTALD